MHEGLVQIEHQSLAALAVLGELANQALANGVLLAAHEQILPLTVLLLVLSTQAVGLSLTRMLLLGLVVLMLLLVARRVLLLKAGRRLSPLHLRQHGLKLVRHFYI